VRSRGVMGGGGGVAQGAVGNGGAAGKRKGVTQEELEEVAGELERVSMQLVTASLGHAQVRAFKCVRVCVCACALASARHRSPRGRVRGACARGAGADLRRAGGA